MERRILQILKGYLRILICGSSYDRFLNLCAFHGIRIWNLLPTTDAYAADLSIQDFRKLRAITKKSHVRIRILERHGLPFFIHKYRKRKFYLVGIGAAFLFMFWLSAHIWNISIEGNVSQTDDIIFEYLDQTGIVHGMPKAQVDCKELAGEIRNYFSQFSWVSVQLKGTRLIIQVKEGILQDDTIIGSDISESDTANGSDMQSGKDVQITKSASDAISINGEAAVSASTATSLAATTSGTVVSIYVRHGIPLVEAGAEVEPGTLLVSGAIPIYDDSKTIVSWQYVNSDADIVIRTKMQYDDEVLLQAEKKQYTEQEKICYQIQFGDMVFALPYSFSDFETYDMITELTQLKLMDNFYLPVYLRKFTVKAYNNQEIQYTTDEAEQILGSNLEYFMKKLEEKGLQIFENDVKIECNEMSAHATGTLTLGEPAFQPVAVGHIEEELLQHEYG